MLYKPRAAAIQALPHNSCMLQINMSRYVFQFCRRVDFLRIHMSVYVCMRVRDRAYVTTMTHITAHAQYGRSERVKVG